MTASPTSSSGWADHASVVYDADCGLCKFVLARVLEFDRARRFTPVALQDPRAAELLPGMSEEERMESFHVVSADGTVHSAGDGLAEVVPALRRFPRAASRLYWLVAGNRGRLGQLIPRAAVRHAERRIEARADGH